LRPEEKAAIRQLDEMLDMGGENVGCVTEPDEFKKRIYRLPEGELRAILNSLDTLLDRTRKEWLPIDPDVKKCCTAYQGKCS
jgi:hypothetical protein